MRDHAPPLILPPPSISAPPVPHAMNRDQPPPSDQTGATAAPGSTDVPSRSGPVHVDDASVPRSGKAHQSDLKLTRFQDINLHTRKEWLVRGMLGTGELSCFYGHPGSTKSLVAADLAFAVAAGHDWFDRPTRHGLVVYIAAERGSLVMRRLYALKVTHNVDNIPLGVITGSIDLRRNDKHVKEIVGFVRQLEAETDQSAALVVLDTINRALSGGDENSPTEMGNLIRQLTTLQELTKAHILTVHHMPVEGPGRMRGHGSLLGACDTTAEVRKFEEFFSVTIKKANDGREDESIVYSIRAIEVHHDLETGEVTEAPIVVPTNAEVARVRSRLDKHQRAMLRILVEAGPDGLTKAEWFSRGKDAGIGTSSDGNFRRATRSDAVKALTDKGIVDLRDGRCFVIEQDMEALGVTRYGG